MTEIWLYDALTISNYSCSNFASTEMLTINLKMVLCVFAMHIGQSSPAPSGKEGHCAKPIQVTVIFEHEMKTFLTSWPGDEPRLLSAELKKETRAPLLCFTLQN